MTKNTSLVAVLIAAAALSPVSAEAGGILTNTNQHINFLRMVARGATNDIDAAYSNPAGTAYMTDGWRASFNIQSAYQNRDIDATLPLFTEDGHKRSYTGEASAPFLPSAFATYNHGRMGLSGYMGIVGGGGKCSFNSGLPMFDSQVMAGILSQTGGTVTPDMYDINSAVKGRQYIWCGQLGATYRFDHGFAGYLGLRVNYFDGNYSGYVTAVMKQTDQTLTDLQLDCDQTGWGVTPIIGVNWKWKGLTLAAKYEFKTHLNIENDTKVNSDPNGALAAYTDGVNTPSDVPALLSAAVGYEFTPRLRATVEYHYFDDKHAGMADDRQKTLRHGTHEVLAGVEFDVCRAVSLSAGYQHTDYGMSDDFQSNTSFYCDSRSVGFGAAMHLTKKITVNAGYFWTMYDKYHKDVPAASPGGYSGTTLAGSEVLDRKNKVFGLGIDYKF